jgi:serine/threonine protein phosphatase PrpC
MFTAFIQTHGGRKREWVEKKANEDRVLCRRLDASEGGPAILMAVADGVSRCADGGAVAQWLLHERLAQDRFFAGEVTPGAQSCREIFHGYLRGVHDAFRRRFRQDAEMLESACTLAGAVVFPTHACVFSCGDSAVFLLRLEEKGRAGFALTRPDRVFGTSMLRDCFSGLTSFAVRVKTVELEPGDVLVAATDGLVPGPEEIARRLDAASFSQAWLDALCADSLAAPGSDDIAVAAVRVGEASAPA